MDVSMRPKFNICVALRVASSLSVDGLQNCVSGSESNDSEGYAATLPESVISPGLSVF